MYVCFRIVTQKNDSKMKVVVGLLNLKHNDKVADTKSFIKFKSSSFLLYLFFFLKLK